MAIDWRGGSHEESINDLIVRKKYARAIELLTPRILSMREVAARCGFADQAHLTRTFKSQFGHPPSLHVSTISD